MKRIVDIISCSDCPKRYDNYMPKGENPKLWCSEVDKEIKPFEGQFPNICTLPTIADIEQQEQEYSKDELDEFGSVGN